MSAPREPNSSTIEPVVSLLLPDLTPGEKMLLSSYRAMDDRSREFIGKLAASSAVRCPRRQSTPTLKLVQRGVS
jgi:hypothetical protein